MRHLINETLACYNTQHPEKMPNSKNLPRCQQQAVPQELASRQGVDVACRVSHLRQGPIRFPPDFPSL